MGRELQKKKRRSGRQPIRQSNKTKKILNPRGNNIIAENWYGFLLSPAKPLPQIFFYFFSHPLLFSSPGANTFFSKNRDKKATLSQNYRRLGLVSRLRAPTGGVEGRLDSKSSSVAALRAAHSAADAASSSVSPFAIASTSEAIISEARVERDASGKITRIIRPGDNNPLGDALAHLDSDDEEEEGQQKLVVTELEDGSYQKSRKQREEREEWGGIVDTEDAGMTDVVRELVEQARNPAPKKARHLSEREAEWLGRLVAKHGENTRAMARDARLNPMQQTAADLARRLKKLNA
ncbi:nucleolar 16 [Cordyceps militaris]|uniref:Nucleolar protein 16 n=1 Tax=Cordyceps militaris TaxID=73501 RepID=A0A2H4SBK2_CORMI|nr:nucleolar 16 [Cordyceps militaris]